MSKVVRSLSFTRRNKKKEKLDDEEGDSPSNPGRGASGSMPFGRPEPTSADAFSAPPVTLEPMGRTSFDPSGSGPRRGSSCKN